MAENKKHILMRKFARHMGMTFLITSTCLLWGVAFQFSNAEIMISACAAVVIYWTNHE